MALKNSPAQIVLESLSNVGIKATVFSDVEIEPTDASFKRAIEFATAGNFDAFIAVGGGSVMDTAKVNKFLITQFKLSSPQNQMYFFFLFVFQMC